MIGLWLLAGFLLAQLRYLGGDYVCTSPVPINLQTAHLGDEPKLENTPLIALRFITEYTKEFNSLGHSEQIKERLINKATKYWSNVLAAVDGQTDSFLITKPCVNNEKPVKVDSATNAWPYCTKGCVTGSKCGEIPIPEKYLQCRKIVQGQPTVETSTDTNYDPADVLLLVDYKKTKHCYYGALVYAETCVMDALSNRPIVGYINFCKDFGTFDYPDEYLAYQALRHQLAHILGFSASMFAYMRNEHGDPRTSRDHDGVPINGKFKTFSYYAASDEVVDEFDLDWHSEVHSGQRKTYVIKTPKLVEVASEHFHCEDLPGVELEEVGVSYNHFKRRVVMDELMSARITVNAAVSPLILAFFQDSGWYTVDISKAETWTWGAGLGCDFVQKSCYEYIQNKKQQHLSYRPWCTELRSADSECLMDGSGFGSCNLVRFKQELSIWFQYFSESEGYGPRYGGSDGYTDFCPYIKINGRNCDHPTTICKHEDNNLFTGYNFAMQHFGSQSVCLNHHTDHQWDFRKARRLMQYTLKSATCHWYECTSIGLVIKVGDQEFRCHNDPVEVVFNVKSSRGTLSGSFVCPACSHFCKNCP